MESFLGSVPSEVLVYRQISYHMLRNSASVQEIELPGRISAGFWSGKLQNRTLSSGTQSSPSSFAARVTLGTVCTRAGNTDVQKSSGRYVGTGVGAEGRPAS